MFLYIQCSHNHGSPLTNDHDEDKDINISPHTETTEVLYGIENAMGRLTQVMSRVCNRADVCGDCLSPSFSMGHDLSRYSRGICRKVDYCQCKGGGGEGQDNNNQWVIDGVKDTGIGIDSEIMPRLFTKFATKSQTGGTGLGFFICKGIIEAHGGRIWAENNRDGKGATFYFSLSLSR